MQFGTGIVLLFWAIQDIRFKGLAVKEILSGGIMLFLLFLLQGGGEISKIPAGVLPGTLWLSFSLQKKDAVGPADGIVLMLLGLIFGITGVLEVLLYALILFVLCMTGVAIRKGSIPKKGIPFIPFLFLGYVFRIFLL